MLSQKARYALHALIVLAEKGGREPMMIADIAEEAGVPRKFLEQILLGLKKRGIVQSIRGRAGGYMLGRNPKEISFADISRETDGPLALSRKVASYMTKSVATCREADTVEDLMVMMTHGRFRHVPVLDGDKALCGLISIGDVVKTRIAETLNEANSLRDYISATA